MVHRVIKALGLAFPLLVLLPVALVAAGAANPADDPPATFSITEIMSSAATLGCGKICSSDCAQSLAHAVASVGDGTAGGDSHTCSAGAGYACGGGTGHEDHHDCEETFAVDDLSRIWQTLARGHTSDLYEAVNHLGSAIQVNYERQAVQIVGCSGVIVAHIPLNDEQLRAMQAAAP